MKARVKRQSSAVARRFITVGVAISAVMVGVSVFAMIYFNPETVARRTLEKMGREYYEEYYYDKFMEAASEEVFEQKKAIFAETGLHPIPLRQLLLYQDERNAKYRSVFERAGFSCDKNRTNVKIIPKEPFTKTDYEIELELSCTKE